MSRRLGWEGRVATLSFSPGPAWVDSVAVFFLCFSLHNFPIFLHKEPGSRQHAKNGVCNSLGFKDFAIGPVNSALPFVEFKLQFRIVISIYQNFFWTSQSDFYASRC